MSGARTIRHNLIVLTMASVTAALLLTSVGMIVYSRVVFRDGLIDKTSALAAVVADNSAAAIAFGDASASEQTLAALASASDVSAAHIYHVDGELFASFWQGDSQTPPPPHRPGGHRFDDDLFRLYAPIMLDGERMGTVVIEVDTTTLHGQYTRFFAILAVVGTAAAAFALFLCAKLQRKISFPIEALASVARRVSEDQNYSTRAELQGSTEIRALVEAFNRMLQCVQDRDAELSIARAELMESIRFVAVGEMAGRTAHEILNPLTGIRGRLTKLEKDEADIENLQAVVDICDGWTESYGQEGVDGLMASLVEAVDDESGKSRPLVEEDLEVLTGAAGLLEASRKTRKGDVGFLLREVDRITRIVDGMRHLSRHQSDSISLSVAETLSEAIEITRDSARKRNIVIHETLSTAIRITGDWGQMIQVWTNLLRNAMLAIEEKSGRAGGEIHVIADVDNEIVSVRIRDSGGGILPEHQSLIFGASFTTRSAENGTGLGLSIVRRLLMHVSGSIVVEDTEIGVGTTFLVQIPLVAARPVDMEHGVQYAH
ncbi:MAG: HAMP domain-containing protein [Kofleriaceae bacterium]|nr:HAMP domain-containing protein [Kofleriaceae bacterium]